MPADNFFKYLLLKTRRFSGFICGFVFFLSGILKLMDPVGAGLVMDSYLDFLHIGFLGFASKPLAFLFALAETIVGTAMITGVWRRITAIIALSLQGFFTLLTILLAIFNPVMDCGCFGEFIHLTHVETLVKNLVICALLSYAYFPMRNLGRPLKRKYVSFGVVCTSVLVFSIFSLSRLPIIDFTDYEPGAQILSADANVADEAFDAMFIYEKDGVQQEFTLENLPDSTWTFVSTQTIQNKDLKSSGATLSFYDNDKEYQDSLAVQENVMVISIYDPQMRQKKWDAAVRMAENARESGFNPMILVAGTPEQIEGKVTGDIPVYFSDYKTLITLNRSNAGATWLSHGYIIKKWGHRAYPDQDDLLTYIKGNSTEAILESNTKGSLLFQGFLLYVFAVMLLL
jgi:uncharacterized membrane protein YphA (DoxX/SURF4 family)